MLPPPCLAFSCRCFQDAPRLSLFRRYARHTPLRRYAIITTLFDAITAMRHIAWRRFRCHIDAITRTLDASFILLLRCCLRLLLTLIAMPRIMIYA